MKKAIAGILALLMILSMFGCGKKAEQPETTSPATVPETVPATEAPTEAPAEVPTVTAKPLYGEILDSYYDAMLQSFEPLQYEEIGLNGLPGMIHDVTQVGYCMEDLDGDGSSELLIGAVDEPYIYAMYTVKDGQEIMVINAGERNTYRISSDGAFLNVGSSSAAQSGYFLYSLENGQLQLQDGIVFDATVNADAPWFYVKDANWDSGTYEPLDTAEAESITAGLDSNIRPIAYIPFAEYNI